MARALKWLGYGSAVLAGLVALAVAVIFLLSDYALGRNYIAQPETLPKPSPAQLADAGRQARILGCLSCHGEGLAGNMVADIPNVVRVQAPNLTAIAAQATDQQLAAAIRQGIGHDGKALWAMPSPMYARLSDGEVAALIAWIRTLPRVEGPIDGFSARPIGRFAIASGKLRPAPEKVAEFRQQIPIDLGQAYATGRRIAATTCSECHGPALKGMTMEEGSVTPDLTLAGAYDLAQFQTLMRTGVAPGGRDLGLMSEVSRGDFRYFTDSELEALHSYLRARADKLTH